ncbi:MAG: response regulator, partial [bacterium]
MDDDEGMCLLIKAKLAKQGIKVTAVNSGKEALDFLKMNRISLMLLDLRLSDITGQELLSILTKRRQSVPFIVVSGTSDVRLTVKMMRLGALDFILKDSAFLDLITLVVTRGLDTLEARRSYEESETRLRYISETIRDIFLLLDSKGKRVVFVSPAFEKIWGVSAEQLY